MKTIIFDIDGTLTDTSRIDEDCYNQAFELTFGLDVSNHDWSKLQNVSDWGITEEIMVKEFNRKPTQHDFEKLKTAFFAELNRAKERDSHQFAEVKGAKDFFSYIKYQSGWNIGIATGSWEKSALLKLDFVGFEYHDIPFSNADYYKSREEITKHTIRQVQELQAIDHTQIIYFGDGIWDYKTCQNLGINFIGIDLLKDGKLINMGAQTVFIDYTNPEEIIKEIEKIKGSSSQ